MPSNDNWLGIAIRGVEIVLLVALLAVNTVLIASLSLGEDAFLDNDAEEIIGVLIYVGNGAALLWVVFRVGMFVGCRQKAHRRSSNSSDE